MALSTLEAEYIASSDATHEALWHRQLEADILQVRNPERPLKTVPISSDNQGALKLITTGVPKQKTKHIAVKYHHSHDEQQQGHVIFSDIHSSQNAANLLTKTTRDPSTRGIGTATGNQANKRRVTLYT